MGDTSISTSNLLVPGVVPNEDDSIQKISVDALHRPHIHKINHPLDWYTGAGTIHQNIPDISRFVPLMFIMMLYHSNPFHE